MIEVRVSKSGNKVTLRNYARQVVSTFQTNWLTMHLGKTVELSPVVHVLVTPNMIKAYNPYKKKTVQAEVKLTTKPTRELIKLRVKEIFTK